MEGHLGKMVLVDARGWCGCAGMLGGKLELGGGEASDVLVILSCVLKLHLLLLLLLDMSIARVLLLHGSEHGIGGSGLLRIE